MTPGLVKGSYLIQSVQHDGYLSGQSNHINHMKNDVSNFWKLLKMKDHHYLIQCLYDKTYLQDSSGGHHTKNFSEALNANSATSITWKLIAK